MGNYLTSAGNAKADFASPGSRPDENYAREVMQLFTIGLYQLKPNGDYVVSAGHLVPTYDNDSITELARVFTGMTYPKGPGEKVSKERGGPAIISVNPKANVRFGFMDYEYQPPRPRPQELPRQHVGEGQPIAAGGHCPSHRLSLETSLHRSLHRPFSHPASRYLKSLPAYIATVAETFRKTNGDLQAVVTAILLNPEARSPNLAMRETAGKLREPWLRFTQMARAFQVQMSENAPFLPTFQSKLMPAFGQFPLASPSVFNFYLPSYEPPGEIIQRNERLPVTAMSCWLVRSSKSFTPPPPSIHPITSSTRSMKRG